MPPTVIDSFKGEYAFLSNFDRTSDLAARLWGYPTVEHYFQAMKFTGDHEFHRAIIKAMRTPGETKRYARTHREDIRDDWRNINQQVMFTGLQRKFAAGTDLAAKLQATAPAYLIEGNYWHDQFWGNCTCPQHADTTGSNFLGEMLMWIREELVDPNAHDRCFKCSGTGEYKIAGHMENGVWKGSTGPCYQCRATGVETVYDRLRTNYYQNFIWQVGG